MTHEQLLSYIPEDQLDTPFVRVLANMPEDIISSMVATTAEPETVLAYAGDEFRNLYLLLNGTLKLSYELNMEFVYTFAFVDAVNILGETESFTHYPEFKATITCATRCQYIVLSRGVFLRWMKTDNDAIYYMATHVAQKYTTQVRQDRALLSASGEDRFLYLLVKYYDSLCRNGVCQIDTPKEQLADEICVSKKTISRSISKLKNQNLLTVSGHSLIVNKEQYEKILELYEDLF